MIFSSKYSGLWLALMLGFRAGCQSSTGEEPVVALSDDKPDFVPPSVQSQGAAKAQDAIPAQVLPHPPQQEKIIRIEHYCPPPSSDTTPHNAAPPAAQPPRLSAQKKLSPRLKSGDLIYLQVLALDPTGKQAIMPIFPPQHAPPAAYRFQVDHKGLLHLPYIGMLQASGHTIAELESSVTKAWRQYIRKPEVYILTNEMLADCSKAAVAHSLKRAESP